MTLTKKSHKKQANNQTKKNKKMKKQQKLLVQLDHDNMAGIYFYQFNLQHTYHLHHYHNHLFSEAMDF